MTQESARDQLGAQIAEIQDYIVLLAICDIDYEDVRHIPKATVHESLNHPNPMQYLKLTYPEFFL